MITNASKRIIANFVQVLILGTIALTQTIPSSGSKQQSSAAANPDDRISKVENSLLPTPIIVPSEPIKKLSLRAEMSKNLVPGLSVAVIDNYQIAWAKGYGVTDVRSQTPVTPDTLFCAGGITKFVTAVAVLRLAQENKLDLDQDVNKYLTSWKAPSNQFTQKHPVTIRELLSHNSGIPRHRPSTLSPLPNLPDVLQLIKHDPSPERGQPLDVIFEPGTEFDYSSGAFLVLELLLTDVQQKPFREIVQELVLDPVGMQHSSFAQPVTADPRPERASGHMLSSDGKAVQADVLAFPELAGSGLWTTPSDLARLVINVQKSGQPGSILSSASYSTLVHSVVSNAALGVFVVGENESRRFRVRTSDGTPSDTFTGWLVGYLNGGKGAVVLANSSGAFQVGFSLVRSVALEYNWRDYVPVRPPAKINVDVYKKYAGRYQLGDNVATVSRSADGKSLLGQIGDSEKVPLYPTSQDSFFVTTELLYEARIRFVVDKAGNVSGLVLEYPDRGESFTAPRIP